MAGSLSHSSDEKVFGLFSSLSGDEDTRGLKYLFNTVYYNFIIEHVKFVDITSRIPCMPRDKCAEIYALDRNGKSKEAGVIFMECLRASEEPGKYQSLLEALRAQDYTHVVQFIENGEITEHHEEHKKIIDIFCGRLTDTIEPTIMANELFAEGVINQNDMEKIQKTQTHNNTFMAANELLDILPRKSKDWFQIFFNLLYKHGHHELCEEIDPIYYEKKKAEVETKDTHQSTIHPQPQSPSSQFAASELEKLKILSDSKPPQQGTPASFVDPDCNRNQCNCRCMEEIDKKFDDLKAYIDSRINRMEIRLNASSDLLQTLVTRIK